MTDLTKIEKPFGLLDKETQDALRALQGGWLVYDVNGNWVDCPDPYFNAMGTYRARPAPLTLDTIDWSHVAPEWKFMARDEDGTPWVFKDRPKADPHDMGGSWQEHRNGPLREGKGSVWNFASYKRGTVAWQDSLVERPA